jgi:aldose sugar dehydrogenase
MSRCHPKVCLAALIVLLAAACSRTEAPPAAQDATPAGAEALAGEWRGQFEIPGGSVLLVLRLGAGPGGALEGAMDLPGPGRMDIPLSGLALNDGELTAGTPDGASLRLRHDAGEDLLSGEMQRSDGQVSAVALRRVEPWRASRVLETERGPLRLTTVAEGLAHPWGLAFLPDGRYLVTERPGHLRIVDREGHISEPLAGLPPVAVGGQGGLLDVVLAPDFEDSRQVYFSYAEPGEEGSATAVARAVLQDDGLREVEVIFRATPRSSFVHFGSRLVFTDDGHLFVTLGDRGTGHRADDAQRLESHHGTLLRLKPDGSIPGDNPFTGDDEALGEIWSYGHRNIQGAALHPDSGALWAHEHGPQGGDEINLIAPGRNYGWPVITYGEQYGGGHIGPPEQEGLEQPFHQWTPSIAPSGMAFYTGDAIPAWRGDLLVGSLRFNQLVRLELGETGATHEERIPIGMRVRDVRQGPDGAVYLLTDHPEGRLLKLTASGG